MAQFMPPPPIKKNLYTFLVPLDIFNRGSDGFKGVEVAFRLLQSKVPVRIGILLVDSNSTADNKFEFSNSQNDTMSFDLTPGEQILQTASSTA